MKHRSYTVGYDDLPGGPRLPCEKDYQEVVPELVLDVCVYIYIYIYIYI